MESHKDYLLSLLRDRYDHESERYKQFELGLSIPITVLTGLFVGIYIVGTDVQVLNSRGMSFVLVVSFFCLLLLFTIGTLILLSTVYFGFFRAWHAFPESKTIHDVDVKKLREYNQEVAPDNFEDAMINDLKDNAIEWYIECNTSNTSSNNKRGDRMFWARLGLILSLFAGLFLLLTVIYIKNVDMSKQEPQKTKAEPIRPPASPVTHQRNGGQDKSKTIIKK